METRTEVCEHCAREVPIENYQMHLVHCKRNFQLCLLCGQAVSRKEEEEHFKEYHERIDCVQCGQKTTRNEEENHLANKCAKTLTSCRYCEILLPRKKMAEHEDFCGSRTEPCEKCSRYVMMKDLPMHEKTCDDPLNFLLPCEFCGALISYDRLDAHQLQCLTDGQSLQGDIPLLVEDDDGLFREDAAATINHEVTGSGNNSFIHSVTHDNTKTLSKDDKSDDSIVALPCEICGELCPSDRLMEHQEECGQQSEDGRNREEREVSNFRFDWVRGNHPHWEVDNHYDGFFPDGTPRVFKSFIQQRLFSDLEERMWPFDVVRNQWSRL